MSATALAQNNLIIPEGVPGSENSEMRKTISAVNFYYRMPPPPFSRHHSPWVSCSNPEQQKVGAPRLQDQFPEQYVCNLADQEYSNEDFTMFWGVLQIPVGKIQFYAPKDLLLYSTCLSQKVFSVLDT